jgi:hypothetical protein
MVSNSIPAWFQMFRYSPWYHYTPAIKFQKNWWIPYQSGIKKYYTILILDTRYSSSSDMHRYLNICNSFAASQQPCFSFNVQVNMTAFKGWSCKKCEHYWYQSYYIYLLILKFTKYMLMPLHTHSISFNYIYHTIYTIFENALIALCILYQNFGEPSIPVPIWYHNVVIPAQHWYQTHLCIWYLSPLGGVLFINLDMVSLQNS